MNRHDVRLLQSIRGYPCVSILTPTHRTAPDNLQDPIRIKNLATEANNRLLTEFSQREVGPLSTRIEKLVAELDYQYMLDGLALYTNHDIARAFTLPFTVRERVVIDPAFATRDLVYALHRLPRYWVLALSEKPTRLFEGVGETLVEVRESGFPMIHTGPGGATKLPGGKGISRSARRDDAHRQFFRQIDAGLEELAVDDPLPVVVVGVQRYLAFLREVATRPAAIIATLEGNYDKATEHELSQQVWPLVESFLADERKAAIEELGVAAGAQRVVSTVGEVWRIVHEGRGQTLLVEEDYHYPAHVDESGLHIAPADDVSAPGVNDDAVDDIIEMALAKGGHVVFVDPGALAQYQRIALIVRY